MFHLNPGFYIWLHCSAERVTSAAREMGRHMLTCPGCACAVQVQAAGEAASEEAGREGVATEGDILQRLSTDESQKRESLG